MPLKAGLVCAAVMQVCSLSSYSARGDLGPIEMVLDLCFWVPAQRALLQEALLEPNLYHQRPEGGFSFIFCWCPLFPQSILYVLTLLLAYWVCVKLLSLFSYLRLSWDVILKLAGVVVITSSSWYCQFLSQAQALVDVWHYLGVYHTGKISCGISQSFCPI